MINYDNIPDHQISGLDTEELEWVSEQSGDRYLEELSDGFLNYRTSPYISPPKYKPMGLYRYMAGGLIFGDQNYRELGKHKLGFPRI